ncbi:hypothetical protein ALC57_08880 [Trachymyrmex cornetzi]|uniref:Uncharacterized protein n=1 Tax=Trachymyrmex cornetzi TaxID=471704 RepID=A0A151J6F9_9HYME|nr:hypothetical protein ALC57_08880 [Trachymyrmex cornetzi]
MPRGARVLWCAVCTSPVASLGSRLGCLSLSASLASPRLLPRPSRPSTVRRAP